MNKDKEIKRNKSKQERLLETNKQNNINDKFMYFFILLFIPGTVPSIDTMYKDTQTLVNHCYHY